MKKVKKAVTSILLSTILLSSELQMSANAMNTEQKSSEVHLNKKYSAIKDNIKSAELTSFVSTISLSIDSTNKEDYREKLTKFYMNISDIALEEAKTNSTFEKWTYAANCCKKTALSANNSHNYNISNLYYAKASYASANASWETSMNNGTIYDWVSTAKLFQQAADNALTVELQEILEFCKQKIAESYSNAASLSWNVANKRSNEKNWKIVSELEIEASKAYLEIGNQLEASICKANASNATLCAQWLFANKNPTATSLDTLLKISEQSKKNLEDCLLIHSQTYGGNYEKSK